MRLIDADALIADLDKGLWGKDWDKALAEAIIEDAPSVDAVEVVRCRECKHFVDEGFYCAQDILPMFYHFYCYYGERREQ